MRLRSFGIGMLVALCFSVAMSSGHLLSATRGNLTLAEMDNHGLDELYYFALIRGAAHGYANLGHTAIKEHRLDPPTTSLAPAVEGLLMRSLGWSLPAAALLGDVLFPFLGAFFLFLALRSLLRADGLAAAGTIGIMAAIGTYWLRSSNPQIPFVLVCAYLALFCLRDRGRLGLGAARALCIGALLFMQPLYASLLLIVEACDAAYRFASAPKRWKGWILSEATIGGVLVVCAIPKFLLSADNGDPAMTDAYHRLGIIPSHYPGAPFLQLGILLMAGTLLWYRKRKPEWKTSIDAMLLWLVAAVLGLSQSLVHGIDATFSSYYVNALMFTFGMTACLLIVVSAPTRRLLTWVATAVTVCFSVSCAVAFVGENIQDRQRAAAFDASPEAPFIRWLDAQPGELVVAAARPLANLVPAYTDHFVLFNSYAYNQHVEDRELAERYLVEDALFPRASVDETYQEVFGAYAGMLGARLRTACNIEKFLHVRSSCAVDVPSLIIHQDALAMLHAGNIDLPALLKKYHVDLIVSLGPNFVAKTLCPREEVQGAYVVYRCS